jgi:hypothetical protein
MLATATGSMLSVVLIITTGVCVAVASIENGVLGEAYAAHGFGGFLAAAYHPMSFSKIAPVLLVFTIRKCP